MRKTVSVIGMFTLLMALGMATPVAAHGLQDTLDLPNGFNPEGITRGPGGTLLVGSIALGAVYQLNPRTGDGEMLVPAVEGRAAVGMKWDRRSDYLYVAGGPTGKVFVYDARDGSDVAVFDVGTSEGTLVNDVVITRNAVYITDSYRAVLYRLPLGCWGELATDAELEEIPLVGDFQFNPEGINANGIVAPSFRGDVLLMVNSDFGELYKVDPATGDTIRVDLGEDNLMTGDGMLLAHGQLYVVQNFLNQIAEVTLSDDYLSGEVTGILTHEDLDIPATIARVGCSLYAVNARFSTPVTPETTYTVVRVPLY
jgi:hypothetical protein